MPDQPGPSLKRRAITSIVLSIVILAAGVRGFLFLKSLSEDSAKAPGQQLPEVVRVMSTARGSYTEHLRGFGKARALRQTTVAAEVSGRVDWVSDLLEPGTSIAFEVPGTTSGNAVPPNADQASPGPIVVSLDAGDLEDQVQRAAADLAGVDTEVVGRATIASNLEERLLLARQEQETAMREWARVEKLVMTKRLAAGELDKERLKLLLRDRAVVDLESQLRENVSAVATLEQRRAARVQELRMAKRNLTRATVHVPAPGVVISRAVTRGDRVAAGSPLFTMIDLSRVEIPIALPARRYNDVKPGATAVVTDPDSGVELWRGSVARIAPTINERERTFFVYVVIAGTPTSTPVAPGTHVEAKIEGRTYADVVVVPREAFVGDAVFVVHPDPDAPADSPDRYVRAERREPELVRLLTAVALVREGLETGDEYVVTNLESVADGSRLRVAPDVAR